MISEYNFQISDIDEKIEDNPHGFSLYFNKKTKRDNETKIPSNELFVFRLKYPLKECVDIHYTEPTIIYRKLISDNLYGNMIKKIYKYHPNVIAPKTTLHFDQLKLFLTTLNFFNRFVLPKIKKDQQVYWVYVGSAHGSNIYLMFKLFPSLLEKIYTNGPLALKPSHS